MNSRFERFLDAQQRDYELALSEVRAGRKRRHWMWYIFPQLKRAWVQFYFPILWHQWFKGGGRLPAAPGVRTTINQHLPGAARAEC
ncbi:DUF1810 family protein [Mucilaginibacter sp.]|uniref:DUF1810 family protein n=1 Tax=Mucilaginibacter sp. TaxID=1882438 RepID=UPI003D0DF05B